MSVVLAAQDLHTCYGRAQILFGVSLNVMRGEVVVLLGRNGAGKSTTLKALMNLVARTRGTIEFLGERIEHLPTHRIARLGLGYVPEERRVFGDLTVVQNLEVGRQPSRAGAPTWTPERLFELFPNLAGMRDRLGSRMSGGEQQMLSIARTLMGNPACVLLDEPSEGLAPTIVDEMMETIREMKMQGLSVLLSEQNLHFAQQVADRAYIIEQGHIRYEGTMQALASDPVLAADFLAV